MCWHSKSIGQIPCGCRGDDGHKEDDYNCTVQTSETSYKSETLITGQQTCPFDNRFTSPWQVSTPNRQHKHTQKEKEKKRKEKKDELMPSHDGYSLLFCCCVFVFSYSIKSLNKREKRQRVCHAGMENDETEPSPSHFRFNLTFGIV